jgi:hypothetical protein
MGADAVVWGGGWVERMEVGGGKREGGGKIKRRGGSVRSRMISYFLRLKGRGPGKGGGRKRGGLLPSTLNPQPSTLNPQPSTLNPQPSTLNPEPSTLNPQPSTLNPRPRALNIEPRNLKLRGRCPRCGEWKRRCMCVQEGAGGPASGGTQLKMCIACGGDPKVCSELRA